MCSEQEVLTLINVTGSSHSFSDIYIDAEVLDRIMYISSQRAGSRVCVQWGKALTYLQGQVKSRHSVLTDLRPADLH